MTDYEMFRTEAVNQGIPFTHNQTDGENVLVMGNGTLFHFDPFEGDFLGCTYKGVRL